MVLNVAHGMIPVCMEFMLVLLQRPVCAHRKHFVLCPSPWAHKDDEFNNIAPLMLIRSKLSAASLRGFRHVVALKAKSQGEG
jgi:hypothetical protein